MFISEIEKEESLWNVMSKTMVKPRCAKNASFKRFPELFEMKIINSIFQF